MNEQLLLELINEWLYHNNKLREITKYLYNRTELFERKYESDYNHDLWNFFSGKITTNTKYENELYKLLTEKQIAKLNLIRLKERGI